MVVVVVAASEASDSGALFALMSAALALPIAAISIDAKAFEWNELSGGAVGFRTLDYREPGRMHIREPMFSK